MKQRAWLEINLNAVRHNIAKLTEQLQPGCGMIAVLKSDAYGQGGVEIATAVSAAKVEFIAVGTLDEGIKLRTAGIGARIMILGSSDLSRESVFEMLIRRLEPTLCSIDDVHKCVAHMNESPGVLSVHVKSDTGFTRLGISNDECPEYAELLASNPRFRLESVFTHLVDYNVATSEYASRQVRRFASTIAAVKRRVTTIPRFHLANSATMIKNPQLHFDNVRIGIAMYGISPFEREEPDIELLNVLRVQAVVVDIKVLNAGEAVSYNSSFVSTELMRIAILNIGYSSGIARQASGKLRVILRGRFVPQVGIVTMEYMMIDVTTSYDAQVGDIATLLGEADGLRITAWELANSAGTIPWDAICRIGCCLPRKYVN